MAVLTDSSWCVYVLECKNKALYTGISNNVGHRLSQHKAGKGARYTRIFGVQRLRYVLYGFSRPEAMKAERLIKTWPLHKKLACIQIPYLKKNRRKLGVC